MRQRVTYGGNFEEGTDGKFTKFYSEDGSYEIIKNNQTGQEKHVIYIGGSPYEANIVYLKNFQEAQGKFVFLHKDYLGSILAITDEVGTKLEQRHFDAWGNLTHLKIGNGAIIIDKEIIRDYLSDGNLVVDRGYTSHEHFAEVGLIHMNGRLYDPLLRRFLNADENIQDPHNTQNYNKYGYVMNNPLLYNDPSGEFFALLGLGVLFWKAVIIGAAIGLASYSVGVLVTGQQWNLGGALKSTLFGAISGAATFGIGSIFSCSSGGLTLAGQSIKGALGNFGLALIQGGAHAISQGVMGLMQGGNFISAAVAGFAGSLGASGWSSVMGNKGASMIAFGALAGGVGAELTGGNFWQGALIGGVVAGLNHTLHKTVTRLENGEDPKYYNKKPAHNKSNPLQEHYGEAVTLSDWMKANEGLTQDQIINQMENRSATPLSSQQGGPAIRYIFHPKTGNVIDMRHMLIVGNNGPLIGNSVEIGQHIAGLPSGLNKQDFYSNSLGYQFYKTYNDSGVQFMRFLGVGSFTSSIKGFLNR